MTPVICVLVTLILLSTSTANSRVITSLKYSKFRVKPTIVNGSPAQTWQIPFLVSIKEPLAKKGNIKLWANLCGGSIIAQKKVLTAAHCFEDNNFHYAKRPYILRAVAGTIFTDIQHTGASGHSTTGTQWRKPVDIKIHHNFNFPNHDLAVVFLDYSWDFSKKNIKPIHVSSKMTDVLGSCITAGYGRTGHRTTDSYSKVLLLAQVDTLRRQQCSLLWEMNMDNFVCSSSVRSDVSEGDSGSPLTCVSGHQRADNGRHALLVGVVSGKNFDKTTLFTRVSEYRKWIDDASPFDATSSIFCKLHNFIILLLCLVVLYL